MKAIKRQLTGMGLVLFLLAATGCSTLNVEPPPATPTPSPVSQEAPQNVLIEGLLVPQPVNAATPAAPSPSEDAGEAAPEPVPTRQVLCATVINAAVLNVRSSPEALGDANRVGQVQRGQVFRVIGNNSDGSWVSVEVPAIDGPAWLSADFVETASCR